MTRFGHKLNYVINTFVKHIPALSSLSDVITMLKARDQKEQDRTQHEKANTCVCFSYYDIYAKYDLLYLSN